MSYSFSLKFPIVPRRHLGARTIPAGARDHCSPPLQGAFGTAPAGRDDRGFSVTDIYLEPPHLLPFNTHPACTRCHAHSLTAHPYDSLAPRGRAHPQSERSHQASSRFSVQKFGSSASRPRFGRDALAHHRVLCPSEHALSRVTQRSHALPTLLRRTAVLFRFSKRLKRFGVGLLMHPQQHAATLVYRLRITRVRDQRGLGGRCGARRPRQFMCSQSLFSLLDRSSCALPIRSVLPPHTLPSWISNSNCPSLTTPPIQNTSWNLLPSAIFFSAASDTTFVWTTNAPNGHRHSAPGSIGRIRSQSPSSTAVRQPLRAGTSRGTSRVTSAESRCSLRRLVLRQRYELQPAGASAGRASSAAPRHLAHRRATRSWQQANDDAGQPRYFRNIRARK
ncbi:MAG: hypothetical protein QOK37_268 [Thermoanaerobaculia bacterium]|nr:hypothetical protein [Thermoanaerobaculia bacterium]